MYINYANIIGRLIALKLNTVVQIETFQNYQNINK